MRKLNGTICEICGKTFPEGQLITGHGIRHEIERLIIKDHPSWNDNNLICLDDFMLSFGSSNDNYDVLKELKKSESDNVVCIFGEEEESDSQKLFKAAGAGIKLLAGSHHYNNDFGAVSHEVINSFQQEENRKHP